MKHTRRRGKEPGWGFRLMALSYRFRDARTPREPILAEADIREGDSVLDFGCGPGSYIPAAARLVGRNGHVYALDIHPLAVRMSQDRARKSGLKNVSTILSGLSTGLDDNCVDVALLYDIYHGLEEPQAVLGELHRVLKPGGALSVHDHHMGPEALEEAITASSIFDLAARGARTLRFTPKEA